LLHIFKHEHPIIAIMIKLNKYVQEKDLECEGVILVEKN